MAEEFDQTSVVLLGCGSIGRRHARILGELGVKRITVYDPVPDQVARLQREVPSVQTVRTLEEALDTRAQAVFVLTPPQSHVSLMRMALDRGADVFCEKPLSDSGEGIEELSSTVEKTGRLVMVGLCFRYHEGVLGARRLLEAGEIGRPVSIRAIMGEHLPTVRPDYRSLFTSKTSGALDLVHDIDLAIWFAGSEVTHVDSLSGVKSDIGIEAPDVVEILMAFERKVIASVHLDFFQQPRRRQLEIFGTEGSIVLEFASWDSYTLSCWTAKNRAWSTSTHASDRDDMFRAEDGEFLRSIYSRQPISCTIAEARKSLEVVLRVGQ